MNKQEAIEKIKNIGTLKINDTVLHQQFDTVIKNFVHSRTSKQERNSMVQKSKL